MRDKGHNGPEPKPRKRLFVRIGITATALPAATLLTVLIRSMNPGLRPGAVFVIFLGACIACYLVWNWIFFERAAELEKRIPISSKELRRRTKEFYDNLPR
jgi:hypothetical protein